jgi:hypothetical protein
VIKTNLYYDARSEKHKKNKTINKKDKNTGVRKAELKVLGQKPPNPEKKRR